VAGAGSGFGAVLGITDHIWTIGELIDAALADPVGQQAA